MSTERQIEANRRNALVSTGPVTRNGKAAVSRNALRHGIFAREAVITAGDGEEDAVAYRQLCAALIADLAPVGQMETLLVEKIAVNYWRLRRAVRHETGTIRKLLDEYMQDAVDGFYNVPSPWLPGSMVSELGISRARRARRQPPPMEMYHYGDEITDAEYEQRLAHVDALRSSDADLAADDDFLQYVYCNHFAPKEAAAYFDRDESIPESEWERARQWVRGLSPQKRASLRRELLALEEQELAEMEEVRLWNKRFEILARLRSLPPSQELDKITKYEAALERSIFRNLAALKSLQASRGSNGSGE